MSTYSENQVDTAMCIWEYVIENKERYFEILFKEHGTKEARTRMRWLTLIRACEKIWNKLNDHQRELLEPFDWEFIPKFIEICVDWDTGCLEWNWELKWNEFLEELE